MVMKLYRDVAQHVLLVDLLCFVRVMTLDVVKNYNYKLVSRIDQTIFDL
jgi:hypothetical protein